MHLGRCRVRRRRAPRVDGLIHLRPVDTEALRQCLKESDPRPNRERAVTGENLAGKRDAGSFPPTGQKMFAQLDEVFGTRRRIATPVTGKQRAAALGNRLQQFPEKRGVHFDTIAGPITRSENHVAMPGTKHNITTPKIISPTKGSTPHITSRSGISGAMLLITKILSPTGG